MNRTLLPALTAAFIAFGAFAASASPSDEIVLSRFSGVNELQHSGVVAVQFVQGREIGAPRADHVVKASLVRAEDQSAGYLDADMILTFSMLLVVAIAFVGVSLASRKSRSEEGDGRGSESWREDVMKMLEADLMNRDGLVNGFSAR